MCKNRGVFFFFFVFGFWTDHSRAMRVRTMERRPPGRARETAPFGSGAPLLVGMPVEEDLVEDSVVDSEADSEVEVESVVVGVLELVVTVDMVVSDDEESEVVVGETVEERVGDRVVVVSSEVVASEVVMEARVVVGPVVGLPVAPSTMKVGVKLYWFGSLSSRIWMVYFPP